MTSQDREKLIEEIEEKANKKAESAKELEYVKQQAITAINQTIEQFLQSPNLSINDLTSEVMKKLLEAHFTNLHPVTVSIVTGFSISRAFSPIMLQTRLFDVVVEPILDNTKSKNLSFNISIVRTKNLRKENNSTR